MFMGCVAAVFPRNQAALNCRGGIRLRGDGGRSGRLLGVCRGLIRQVGFMEGQLAVKQIKEPFRGLRIAWAF
jgi:hypothetical protein